MTEKGKFIVFEGNDGVGKSTQVTRLVNYLAKQGIEVVTTKDPGGILETAPIRTLVLDPRIAEDGPLQALLFTADRRARLLLEIIPALNCGKTVISDRFYGSTRVYQVARRVSLNDVILLERLALNINGYEVEPEITILIDLDPEKTIVRKSGQELNYFDKDSLERQKKRREAYLQLAENLKWEVVNGDKSEDEVFGQILKILRMRKILPREVEK